MEMENPTTQSASSDATVNKTAGNEVQHTSDAKAASSPAANDDGGGQLSGLRLVFLLVAIYTSVFLIALDQLIVSTAIPRITDEFHSLQDIGWYGSAYLLTSCSFQLMFGKIYTFFPIRTVFLLAVFLFEAGSAICGAAPSSAVLIGGRSIQGVGAAGIYSGAVVGIVYSVPLRQRPLFMGLFGAVSGVASILGPLVGGAFTSNVSWRWCFYINLPFGAVTLLIVAIVLRQPLRAPKKLSLKAKLAQLDIIGTTFLIPGVVSILLALQWGGSTYAWNDRRIIALLTLGVVLLIAFIVVQKLTPQTATVPGRIFKQRSIYSGFWAIFFIGAQMNLFLYFIPIWFQAVTGVSAVSSGIRLLPFPLATIIASILVGIAATVIGYYTPFLIAGSVFMSVGAGLLTTLQVDTGMPKWVGYQVLYGFGLGMGIQAPNLAAQTVLPLDDVATGTSLMLFNQLLGGAIFVSVGQSVFNNGLVTRLSGIDGIDSSMIEGNGATSLGSNIPPGLRDTILVAYNEALRDAFRVGLILASLTIIGAVGMEWRSVKTSPSANEPEHVEAQAIIDDPEKKEVRNPVPVPVDEEEAQTGAGEATKAEPLR
ncbi:putative MFS aflatoxin efflux pump [Hypoxylon cercidicola]|nr:putative MFS aflatoxin efflux pump [Hypoxylon cercidicola]